jgi:hypothetical protein
MRIEHDFGEAPGLIALLILCVLLGIGIGVLISLIF